MFLNDSIWIVLWFLLFRELGTINGYNAADATLVFGIGALGFGLVFVFFGNANNIYRSVEDGGFDFYLMTPLDEVFHAYLGRMMYSAIGDVLFGMMIILVLAHDQLPLALCAAMLGAIVLFAFEMMIDSLSFFVSRPRKISAMLHRICVSVSVWPVDTYSAGLRGVMYLTMVAFIAAVPRNVVASASWSMLGWLAVVATLLLTTSILLFKFGLRRYESGNMMTTRT